MENDLKFETFIFISNSKFIIYVLKTDTFESIYQKELLIKENTNILNLEKLDEFLEKNIYNIEKVLGNFIEDINIIFDSQELFNVNISTTKIFNQNTITTKSLSHPLNELKNQCNKSLQNQKIIHMIIENYKINGQNYSSLPENINCENFSLNVKFICIPNNLFEGLKKILKKYQIFINLIQSAEYLRKFPCNDRKNIFEVAFKLMNGHNNNEILLKKKTLKNKGFFEKFFDFFS